MSKILVSQKTIIRLSRIEYVVKEDVYDKQIREMRYVMKIYLKNREQPICFSNDVVEERDGNFDTLVQKLKEEEEV